MIREAALIGLAASLALFTARTAPSRIITRDDVDDAEYRVLGAQPQFASAVRILSDSGGSGSGVVIGKRWVITAAHVAYGHRPSMLRVLIGEQKYSVVRIIVHADYLTAPRGLARSAFDQALLELESDAPVAPMPISKDAPVAGTLGTFVGYGVGGPNGRDSVGTRRGATNRVDQVGGKLRTTELADNILLTDFDSPRTPDRNKYGSAIPEALEGLASGGDSGGGLFTLTAQGWRLIGTFSISMVDVAAAMSQDFSGSTNVFIGIAPHAAWIERVTGVIAVR